MHLQFLAFTLQLTYMKLESMTRKCKYTVTVNHTRVFTFIHVFTIDLYNFHLQHSLIYEHCAMSRQTLQTYSSTMSSEMSVHVPRLPGPRSGREVSGRQRYRTLVNIIVYKSTIWSLDVTEYNNYHCQINQIRTTASRKLGCASKLFISCSIFIMLSRSGYQPKEAAVSCTATPV